MILRYGTRFSYPGDERLSWLKFRLIGGLMSCSIAA